MFATYVECYKMVYQYVLALATKTNYGFCDPSTGVCHFLNEIAEPLLAQAKVSLKVDCNKYLGNFSATAEYLMIQVSHQQVNQQLHITSVGSSVTGKLKTLVVHVVNMLAKCWQNIQMSKILEKLCHFATFCLKQTQNLPVKPVLGGEPRTDPPSHR